MLRLVFAAICALPLLGTAAFAQAPASARATCDTRLKPAYENAKGYKENSLTADCACLAGFMTGRYGDEDGELLLRLFAVFANENEAEVKEAVQKLGETKFRALMAKIGKFQDVGREMDKNCPAVKKP